MDRGSAGLKISMTQETRSSGHANCLGTEKALTQTTGLEELIRLFHLSSWEPMQSTSSRSS